MNYITVLGYPEHADFKHFWPADVQVIGKDIVRFHAAIWPAMLLSAGLELPKQLYVHSFINIDGKNEQKPGQLCKPARNFREIRRGPIPLLLFTASPATKTATLAGPPLKPPTTTNSRTNSAMLSSAPPL